MSEPVECQRDADGVAIITVNRPERRNALSIAVKAGLITAVQAMIADQAIRVIILTGAGGIFVAGTDIAEMANMSAAQQAKLDGGRIFSVLRDCPKPVIAAVEGYALGGGCELALACDMIIAGETARFGQPEIRVGIIPGGGGSQLLLRTVGKYRAARMVLTGEMITASEAQLMGLISEMVPDGAALGRAIDLAHKVCKMPPLAVRAAKELLQIGQDLPLTAAFAQERKSFQRLFDTDDQKEGMAAFLEKRQPRFTGT